MTLSSAKYLKEQSGQRPRVSSAETGWQEVNWGLRLVICGYFALLVGGLLSGILIWLTAGDHPLVRWLQYEKVYKDILPVGLLALIATLGLSYGLVLLGQWRCLMHAPEREHAKEFMLITMICVVICSVMSLLGLFTGGQDLLEALKLGSEGLNALTMRNMGVMLMLGSLIPGLAGSLFFNQFLRSVAMCFGNNLQARHVDINLGFVGLLVGGSAGAVIGLWHLSPPMSLLPWVGLGWLFCFSWHVLIVVLIRRCITGGLRHQSGLRKAIVLPTQGAAGQAKMHSLSGLRRLMKPPHS